MRISDMVEEFLVVGSSKGGGVGGVALGEQRQQCRHLGKGVEARVGNLVGDAVIGEAALGEHEVGGGGHAHVGLAVADHQHALVSRRGFALAVAGRGAAGIAGIGEIDAPTVLVDLAQAISEDRQKVT